MAAKKKTSSSPRSARNTPEDKIRFPEKKEQKKQEPVRKTEDQYPQDKYYRLKTQAVDDLVSANEENSPPVSAAELRKYRSGPQISMADWVKAILIKIWFAGVICYFFIWGLSTFTLNPWDHIAVVSAALGTVTNVITNNLFRFIAKTPGAYDRWMMVTSKKIWFLPLDLAYALVLVVCTWMTYSLVNAAAAAVLSTEGTFLGVEPILFGIFVTGWDLIFLGMKRLLIRIVDDARRKARVS